MTPTDTMERGIDIEDETAFAARAERHRRELHVHCYRMLGSFEEAEDAVQDALLRAWKARDSFDATRANASFRAWLYRIATTTCLDALRRNKRRPTQIGTFKDVAWLTPYPDELLDELTSPDAGPDDRAVARESIELAFLVAIQLLPPRQRAALLLRDVLGWSAAETASLLGTTVPAANSALQRARATLEQERPTRDDAPAIATSGASAHEQRLLEGFIRTHENGDIDAAVALLREDIRVSMPPYPMVFDGLEQIVSLMERAHGGDDDGPTGEWRLVPTRANRMPTAASYLKRPGDTAFRAFKFDVLRIEDDRIAEITTFGPMLFGAFGLPLTID